jgi:hypothetical protein
MVCPVLSRITCPVKCSFCYNNPALQNLRAASRKATLRDVSPSVCSVSNIWTLSWVSLTFCRHVPTKSIEYECNFSWRLKLTLRLYCRQILVFFSSCCDRRSVGVPVLVSGIPLEPMTTFVFFFLLPDNCFALRLGAPSLTRGRVYNL